MVDPVAWKLYRDGQEVHLEPTVLRLLVYLINHRDRLVTRTELMDTVWADTVISDSALSQAIARLRKALEEDPVSPRHLETVHSKGYRFTAEVEEIDIRTEIGARRQAVVGRQITAVALITLLAILSVIFWPRPPHEDTSAGRGFDSLAVLPFANLTGDPSLDFFVDGMHEVLITELSQASRLRVTSRQSTLRYRTSEMAMPAIASELGVDLLIEGSALKAGDRVELTVQLIDGRTDKHLWADRYARDTAQVFDLLTSVANTIVSKVPAARTTGDVALPANHHTGEVDPDAAVAYLRGLHYLNRFSKDGFRNAIEQFTTATDLEPEFALAWGNMAAAQAMVTLFGHGPPGVYLENARDSALRALEADERFYIGYATLGWVQFFTRDFEAACDAFQNALRLNPSDPYSLHGDADCLMMAGRWDESVAQVRKAQLIDPFTAMHCRPLPYHLFFAGRTEEAEAAALDLQQRIPGQSIHSLLALIYWQQGKWEKALEEQRLEFQWHKDEALIAALENGLARADARGAMLAVAKAMVERSATQYVDPFRVGETFVLADAVDDAFYWLNRAIDQGSLETNYIPVRPDFGALRGDPRYAALLEKLDHPAFGPDGRVIQPDGF